jgi:LacI family transcriptional regulator
MKTFSLQSTELDPYVPKVSFMKSNIKEVARRAGVSIATVSRVFNRSSLVTKETSDRVMRIARQLKYSPNASARSLSMKKTYTFVVLFPDLHGEFFSEVIRGADQTAQKNSYNMLLSSAHNSADEIISGLNAMRGRVDGLIIMSPHISAHALNSTLPKSLPVVLLNCVIDDTSFDSIVVDNFNGSYEIVKHLLMHDHHRIAVIKGVEGNYETGERLRGYRYAVAMHNGLISDDLEITGDFSEESGYDAIGKLMKLKPRPTAVFASNDSMAIGALKGLHDAGIRVPEDMALAGFDDIPIVRYIKPSLSSVHVPIYELGILAVQRLLNSMNGKNMHKKQQIIIPTKIITRESCGCVS